MNAITLPKDLEVWAEAEVAAGRAVSLEALLIEAAEEYRRQWAPLRQSLDRASAEAALGQVVSLDEAFDPLITRFTDRA